MPAKRGADDEANVLWQDHRKGPQGSASSQGDDECCWGEAVPLAGPPLVFGKRWPEEADGGHIIDTWERALAEQPGS